MAKIVVESDFVLEVGDETYHGILRNFTKAEEKTYKKKLKKLKKEEDQIELTFKLAIEMRVHSESKEEILKLGEDFGYEMVYKTILLDILESTKKKDIA